MRTGSVEFCVLGQLDVLVAGEPVGLGGPRPRTLLAVLLAHAGRSVSARHLVDQLWGEQPPATAKTALQMHVSTLRKALGDRLVTVASGYLLDAAAEEVDARRFEAMVIAARHHLTEHPARASADLAAALALWQGEPYSGVPACPDVDADRLRLSELRLCALEERLDAELTLGRHAQIVSELASLVLDNSIRQRLVGLYLLALYRCGRIGEAQAAYQALRATLDTELGVEPGGDVIALATAIDRRDPTLDPPSSIPVPPSRFIGRRRELEQLADQLGQARLLTVTGPGGIGKTRLALELARDTATDYPHGVYVIELATAPPGSPVADRVATGLTVRPRTDEPLLSTLATHLRDLRALIVLDNCEHLVESCARLSTELLGRCAGLRIVATSREPLGVAGEQVWPLAGLTVPTEADADTAAARTEAVRLLGDRGGAARAGFTIHSGNIATAGWLCRRLDGLPLAIELAAAQLRALSLQEIAERVGRRLDLADHRSRTIPDRHRTVRATLDWSHQLLEPEEQTVLRRLSVFVGGCRLDAAEQVTDGAHDVLARLIDRSLLIAEPQPDGTRYRMLELVSEYATERLTTAGDRTETRQRHAVWCTELARAAAQYGGADHTDLVRRLGIEEGNLRAALDWCLGDGADPVRALDIASPLWWYWWARGLMVEGRDWLRRGLAAIDPAPSLLRGSALRASAALARNSGDYSQARRLGQQCLAVYQALGETVGIISALGGLCITSSAQRDFPAALHFGQESLRLAEEAGDRQRYGAALNNIGIALRTLGRLDEATAMFAESLDLWNALDDRRGQAAAVGNLGIVARQSGERAKSRRLCLESLAQYRTLGIVDGMLDMLDCLACLEVAEERPASALRLLGVADRERHRLGAPLFIQDEIADREAAWTTARAALGPQADTIIDAIGDLELNTVVNDLLAV